MRRLVLALIASLAWSGADRALAAPDLATAVARTAMADRPAAQVEFRYQQSLYLLGLMRVWQRTRDPAILAYVRTWGEARVAADGSLRVLAGTPVLFDRLDNILPGRVILALYEATGDERYRRAAIRIRTAIPGWETVNGAYTHRRSQTAVPNDELWADGSYMYVPFLLDFDRVVGSADHADRDLATDQLRRYVQTLQNRTTGLFHHAYDANRRNAGGWADPVSGLSPVYWCRANGWIGMAMVEALTELRDLPDHPDRAPLLAGLRAFATALARVHDPGTWRWRQVIDPLATPGNWAETSCSAMHVFTLHRALQLGLLETRFEAIVARGWQGVTEALDRSGGRTTVTGTSEGRGPIPDVAYYLAAQRPVNDFHGLGAFLLAHEQVGAAPNAAEIVAVEAEGGTITAPLRSSAVAQASAGRLVRGPARFVSRSVPPANGRAVLSVQVPRAGTWYFWGRFLATSAGANAVWVRIDRGPWRAWTIPIRSRFYWRELRTGSQAPAIGFSLAAGAHRIELAYLEAGTGIDALLLTRDRGFVPAGTGW